MNKLTIAIDALNISRGGGLTYLIEFVSMLNKNQNKSVEIHVWSSKLVLSQLPEDSVVKHEVRESEKGFFARLFWQFFTSHKIFEDHKIDILLVPGTLYLGFFRPYVVISQNMLPFEFREALRFGFSSNTLRLIILRFFQSISMVYANGVIFLSNYASENIKKIIKIKNSIVIPHGISLNYMSKPRIQYSINDFSITRPYKIVYTSFIGPYKHQWNVAQAIGLVRSKGYPVTIDFVGKPVFNKSVQKLNQIKALIDPDDIWIRNLDEVAYDQLPNLYKNYDMAIFASSCENLPIVLLEKMASGLPIACSNLGPMPTIIKNGAAYFDPLSVDSIKSAVTTLICDAKLRSYIAMTSYHESQQYSWDKTVNLTYGFLKQLIKNK